MSIEGSTIIEWLWTALWLSSARIASLGLTGADVRVRLMLCQFWICSARFQNLDGSTDMAVNGFDVILGLVMMGSFQCWIPLLLLPHALVCLRLNGLSAPLPLVTLQSSMQLAKPGIRIPVRLCK